MSIRGKAEQQLETRARPPNQARAPNDARLSASAAHEINNPLDSLLNLLYLLEAEDTLSAQGRHYLTLAEEEVRRISTIARTALDRQKAVVAREGTNVSELLAAVLEFYKQKLEAAGISVEADYALDFAIPVYAGALRQVFSNLLLNAVEAMPQGGKIHARVSSGREWSGEHRRGVRVTVGDNGSGIPAAMMRQIFQPLFSMKPQGSGMGLSLVTDVVRRHRGLVRVRSSTQAGRHGTVFNLFLPAA
jgi:signal transduction histidine kinase